MMTDFENLVDELLKPEPNEKQIQFLMEKLDIEYNTDTVGRIGEVLEKMNHLVFSDNNKKGNYDLR